MRNSRAGAKKVKGVVSAIRTITDSTASVKVLVDEVNLGARSKLAASGKSARRWHRSIR